MKLTVAQIIVMSEGASAYVTTDSTRYRIGFTDHDEAMLVVDADDSEVSGFYFDEISLEYNPTFEDYNGNVIQPVENADDMYSWNVVHDCMTIDTLYLTSSISAEEVRALAIKDRPDWADDISVIPANYLPYEFKRRESPI